MYIDTLMQFCTDNGGTLDLPWTAGEWTYASNRFIVVRCPALDEDPGGRGVASIDRVYRTAGPKPETGWVDVPEMRGLVPCPMCSIGGGRSVCHECDGTGSVTLSNKYSTYDDITCDSCDGSGCGDFCEPCNGTGRVEPEPVVEIGGVWFIAGFVRQLTIFKNLQVAPVNCPDQPNWFRFDGGDALLLPTRS